MKQHFCPAEQSMIAFEKECNWCGELESQEPVAILNHAHGVHTFRNVNLKGLPDGEYLVYTHPPQRTWVGLTNEERLKLYREFEDCLESDGWEYEKAIEARLKELNT